MVGGYTMNELIEKLFGTDYLKIIGNAIPVILAMIVTIIVIRIIMKFIKKIIAKSKLDKGLHSLIERTIRIILYFVAILIIADMMGIPISSLLATFSIVGLAASLAIQDTLSNLASGITILATHPFRIGNFVEAGGISGSVMEISFTHTVLKTPDNKVIRIPNKQVVDAIIINYSEMPKRRVDLTFNLAYSADSEKIKEIMKKAAEKNEFVLKDEDIFVRTTAYGASGIDYTLRVWTEGKNYWTVYFDLLEGIKKDFDKAGIEIPFNQLDVHVING